MSPKPRPLRPRPFALSLLLAAAACGPLVQVGGGGKPPGSLFVLRSAPAPAPGPATATRATVLVDQLTVVGTLQTLRIPVIQADTRVTYLIRATWAEQPSKQFQRVLIDTLAQRPGIIALGATQIDGRADRRLSGTLIEFGLDMRDPTHPQVRLRFDAVLTGPDRALIAVKRFDIARPVSSAEPDTVAEGLNAAANLMAADVATWTQQTRPA